MGLRKTLIHMANVPKDPPTANLWRLERINLPPNPAVTQRSPRSSDFTFGSDDFASNLDDLAFDSDSSSDGPRVFTIEITKRWKKVQRKVTKGSRDDAQENMRQIFQSLML
jgi:hypothetical protein